MEMVVMIVSAAVLLVVGWMRFMNAVDPLE